MPIHSIEGPLVEDTGIYIYQKQVGYVFAVVAKDYSKRPGDSSLLSVYIDDVRYYGISCMTVNTDLVEVYHEDDPVVIRAMADLYIKEKSNANV